MRIKLSIAVLIQLLLLLSIVAYKQYGIASGERILLVTRTFDPRDMLKGDYVRLSYDISSLKTDKFGVKDTFKERDTIYVTLSKNADGTFSPVTFGKTEPKGATFIRGKVITAYGTPTGTLTVKEDSGLTREFDYYWSPYQKEVRYVFCVNKEGRLKFHFPASNEKWRTCDGDTSKVYGTVEKVIRHEDMQINAEYGIEKFFVEEGKGRTIEHDILGQGVKAVIYLSKDGRSVLKTLIINGRELS
ncbi:MAG: GDYXXLXY domain-containing protein [Nitrospirae bacterium]|nr:GDYXXLXY domain-containing protein [Nitrospirota bacterium]